MKLYNVTISGNTIEEFLTDLENARAWINAQRDEIAEIGGDIDELVIAANNNATNENITNLALAVRNGNQWAAENGGQDDDPPLEYLAQEQIIANILDNDDDEEIDELEQLYNRYF